MLLIGNLTGDLLTEVDMMGDVRNDKFKFLNIEFARVLVNVVTSAMIIFLVKNRGRSFIVN
jgi:hypothetical protein